MASPYIAFEHDYDFVEMPSSEFFCPVTSNLLTEPYQTLCCGNHLLQEAVTKLQQYGEPVCPLCKQTLRTMPDMFFKRKVYELRVHCPNKSLGCEWVGELGNLHRHLSQDSIEGGCQFETVDCPHSCSDKYQRRQLEEHMANNCSNRPFTCQYCGHEATYIEVTNEHLPVCERYPVECSERSLGCQWAGERGDLDRHLCSGSEEGECQFVTVACPYGCSDDGFQRGELEGHKADDCPNRQFHCQYCGHEATFIKVTNEHWPLCERYPVDCANKSLGCQWAGERGDLDQHLNRDLEEGECQFVTVACPYGCGDGFQRCRLKGHKASDCPKRVFTCNYCSYEATYNEVISEHWPICKKFILQCSNECGENAIERQLLQKHLDKTCPRQVIKCEFRRAGCLFESQRQYMKTHLDEKVKVHLAKVSRENELQQEAIDQQQRQIDLLLFKIDQQQDAIRRQQIQIDQLQSTAEQYSSELHSRISALNQAVGTTFFPPPKMEMANFEKLKTENKVWHSPPFYSHIGGYTMCLCVDANGKESGQGTHVSVWIQLIKGEHDRHLQWPFRGEVTVQLLNQRSNEGHLEKIFLFDNDDVAHKDAWWKLKTKGMGYGKFIAHTELNTEDKEYLRDDCLKFKISEVVGVESEPFTSLS